MRAMLEIWRMGLNAKANSYSCLVLSIPNPVILIWKAKSGTEEKKMQVQMRCHLLITCVRNML